MPRPRRHLSPVIDGADRILAPRRSSHGQPERRCAVSTCRAVLARDNPHRWCSPCMDRVSDTPHAVRDYLNE